MAATSENAYATWDAAVFPSIVIFFIWNYSSVIYCLCFGCRLPYMLLCIEASKRLSVGGIITICYYITRAFSCQYFIEFFCASLRATSAPGAALSVISGVLKIKRIAIRAWGAPYFASAERRGITGFCRLRYAGQLSSITVLLFLW